jgi:bifunctional non-homologous end joining protein LigD
MAAYAPQLATLVDVPPSGAGWLHEIKYDGYRIGCCIDGRTVTLLSRNGNDWTAAYPEIAKAALALGVRDAIIDGEVAALLPDGRTSFQELQHGAPSGGRGSLVYFVFDLLRLDGENLEPRPLVERKARLKTLVAERERFRFSEHVEGSGSALLARACREGLEGIISKRADRPYSRGRSRDWLKSKCIRRQEFVVGGFTDPEGMRAGIGALLIGYYEGERLVFAGKVGTGFTQAMAVDLRRRLDGMLLKAPAFETPPPRAIARRAHWVKPALVCEVAFTEWTRDGMVRHPSFQGLRTDKPPREVRIERTQVSADAPAGAAPPPLDTTAGVTLSHPDRRLYVDPPITARQVARYYEAMAAWILPHVTGRPLTPRGRNRAGASTVLRVPARIPSALRSVRVSGGSRAGAHLVAGDLSGLVSLVQLGATEIQTHHVGIDDPERPNRLVIRLEPGDDVSWGQLAGAARQLRSLLGALDLESFCQTTGGRALHVVVPLVPHAEWHECLAFARALCSAMARTDPDVLTARPPKVGPKRILVDCRSNDRGGSAIAAFSTSSYPGAPIAVPIAWDDLRPALSPAALTIDVVLALYARARKDPWAAYWQSRQKLTKERLLAVTRVSKRKER